MANRLRGLAAMAGLLGVFCAASGAVAEPAGPLAGPAFAASVPEISPEAAAIASAGARETGAGDPDEDATIAAQADAEARGILTVKDHEAALLKVLADMPAPFVRRAETAGVVTYRADSAADCLEFAAALPRASDGQASKFICKGNPYPSAGFYLGSYYNEIGQPERALAVLDRGLIAGPDATLLIAERNAALISLRRWDDVLAGAARGLAIANLSPHDHALMLRNRGFALTELKRLDEAQQAYEASLVLVPNNALAQNELRYIASLKAGAAPTPGTILMPNRPKPN
jgi:tetratricopeptide (TPR) repeat protein